MAFPVLEKVRTRPPSFLEWICSPFSSFRRYRDLGKEFVILAVEKGKYSRQIIYIVSCGGNREDFRCFFENEVEIVNKK